MPFAVRAIEDLAAILHRATRGQRRGRRISQQRNDVDGLDRRLCRPHDCADLASESADRQGISRRQVGTITTRRRRLPGRRSRGPGTTWSGALERAGGHRRLEFAYALGKPARDAIRRDPSSSLPPLTPHLRAGDVRHQPEQRDCADLPTADSLSRRRSSHQVGTITRSWLCRRGQRIPRTMGLAERLRSA
jgi:hypothetical protein